MFISLENETKLVTPYLIRSVFSEQEVCKILDLGGVAQGSEWWIGRNDLAKRSASSTTISKTSENEWVFQRLTEVCEAANTRYRFDLSFIDEQMMFARYKTGDFFDWHIDLGEESVANRKLSIVTILSEPNDFVGGELDFRFDEVSQPKAEIGSVFVFPSYLPHRVATVQSGLRYSLVAWMCGPAFK
jgi:PKHD-type hydroxylase